MSKMIIVEGNSNDKDQIRNYMVSGLPGISPTANVTKTDGVATITITDENGTTSASVTDGDSPTVSTSKTDGTTTITITDINGTHTAEIDDGVDLTGGVPTNGVIGFDGTAEDIPNGYEQTSTVFPSVLNSISSSTTDTYSANYINETMNGVVLYESETGTTGDVTLSESVQGYNYIEIFAHRAGRHFSQKIYQPNGKETDLIHGTFVSNYLYYYVQVNTISGSTITRGDEAFMSVNTSGTVTLDTNNLNIYIDRVIGYK